ncbi:MAG: hypothetical protein GX409_03420 [candidate division Zixibacteria bacterium]|nr:hypothetical protein [candidate division Zixibacteria bacterium]
MKYKLIIWSAVIGLAIVAIIAGCEKAELKGDRVANIPPTISWSNVPLPDSVFRSNAKVYWFGKDIDGEIKGYYYFVALESQVGADPDVYINQLPELSQWHYTDSTVVTVRLYAPENEQDTLPQYVYAKCVDNDGAFSNTIYRRFSRINHLPVTILGDCPGSTTDSMALGDVVWCLPETTSLWKGLKVTWAGKDTIDFPDDQPDFDYEWKLYGPYDTSSGIANALTLADTAGHTPINSSLDSTTLSVWVKDKEHTFLDLRTGVYIFVVRVRDDAQAPDPTAAWRKFMAVEPVWISNPADVRDVILSQATEFYNAALPGYPLRNNPPNFPDSLIAFYTTMVENSGYTISIFDTARNNQNYAPPIPVEVLAKFRMVIVDNLDFSKPDLKDPISSNRYCKAFNDYLAIGGKIWVIGRQAFCASLSTSPNREREDFIPQSLAYQYFNLSGASYGPLNSTPVAEFNHAKSILPVFENLFIDSLRCAQLRQFGISKVDVVERSSGLSQTLFTFGSINADTSHYEDLPVAVRFEPTSRLYKTAYFSFPLYLMDNSEGQVQHIFDVMLAWFLDDQPI